MLALVIHGHVFTAQIPEEMDKLERPNNSGDLFFFFNHKVSCNIYKMNMETYFSLGIETHVQVKERE